MPSSSLLALAALALAAPAAARIHSLHIVDDPRSVFSIESFGFMNGGRFELDIHDVSVKGATDADKPKMGFVVYPALTEAAVNQQIDALLASGQCALELDGALVIDISEPNTWKDYRESATVEGEGMFNVLFARCGPVSVDASVSFSLDAIFVNPGPNVRAQGVAAARVIRHSRDGAADGPPPPSIPPPRAPPPVRVPLPPRDACSTSPSATSRCPPSSASCPSPSRVRSSRGSATCAETRRT